ncbi:MAG: 4Fe-4S binding protein [Candidatus Heimdallarchaeota archaeon]|nr:4Fe-4S binding protein [Candidatus Heimdallarchaeota archaeon]
MGRRKWFVELLKKAFPKRFFLAKLTRIPGIRYLVDKLLFDDDEIFYLAKDNVINNKLKTIKQIEINREVALADDIVLPSSIINHFIDNAKYHWIMNFCVCREANECRNYSSKLGCLFMGEAVLKINPAFGRLVTKDEAKKHIKKCSDEGLIHLIGRNKVDVQWLGTGPGNRLLTICNCCECCCLWKMIPELDLKIGRKLNKMPGLKVQVLSDRCIGCGSCTNNHCFIDAIKLFNGKAVINENLCRGCCRCVEVCKENAIKVIIEDDSYINETIKRISSKVDVS